MTGWLGRAWSTIRGLPADASNALHAVQRAIVGWALNIFHLVGGAWHDLTRVAHHFAGLVDGFTRAVVAFAHRVIHVYLPQLAHWAAHEVGAVAADLRHLATSAAQWVAHEAARAWADLQGALSWLHDHVWVPLRSDVDNILHWVNTEARDAVRLITHPALLLDLLAGALSSWLKANVDSLLHQAAHFARTSLVGDTQWLARRVEHALTDLL